jgi:hypothetical protein
VVTTGVSFLLIVLATVLRPCQAILDTTTLDVPQWLLCLGVALPIVAVSEIRKAVLRRTAGTAYTEQKILIFTPNGPLFHATRAASPTRCVPSVLSVLLSAKLPIVRR